MSEQRFHSVTVHPPLTPNPAPMGPLLPRHPDPEAHRIEVIEHVSEAWTSPPGPDRRRRGAGPFISQGSH